MTVFTEEESIDAPTENSERKDCDGRERRGHPWEFWQRFIHMTYK